MSREQAAEFVNSGADAEHYDSGVLDEDVPDMPIDADIAHEVMPSMHTHGHHSK